MEMLWLGLMVALLFIEAGTVSLVSVWFGAGALAALIASLCGAQLWLQIVLFFGVAVLMLLSLRPVVQKLLKPKIIRTNVDALVGTRGYVTADIDNLAAKGQVKLGHMEWSARSTDETVIPQGTLVEVDRIEGAKAYVTPVEVTVHQ